MTNKPLPLVFTFREYVQGNGFLAFVVMEGKALLEVEEGEYWLTGINPAGFAGGGLTRSEALTDFRRTWEAVLYDLSAESASFDDFHNACHEFLATEVAHLTADWEAALDFVREYGHEEPGLKTVRLDEHSVQFCVLEIDPKKVQPTGNVVEELPAVVTRSAAA